MTDVHVFSEPFELGGLSTLPFLRSRGRGRIRFSGRLAAHERSAEWEKELNRHYFACGCDTGAKGTLIGFIGAVLFVIDSLTRDWFNWTAIILLSIALIVAASIVGKLLGLFRADHRLKDLVRHIQQQMPPDQTRNAGPQDRC